MQERKNKILLVSLSVLVIMIIFFAWRGRGQDRAGVDKNIFQIDDYTSIDKVVLESGGVRTVLQFNGTRWKVNEQHDADRNMVSVLFATLQQARAKRKIAESIKDSVRALINKNGVRVSLFAGSSLQQEFLSGGNSTKTQALFHDPLANETYVMEIPGYRVYVSGIFELDENGWRDKYVFNFNWRNFSGLEVRFPGKPGENFTVASRKGFFGIEGMDADTARLNTFLDHVSLLTVDRYADQAPKRDSLATSTAQMEIIVRDVGSREYRLQLFGSQTAEVPGLVPVNQLAYFNVRKIQPLIRPKSFYRKR
jgi:hypothetical protein